MSRTRLLLVALLLPLAVQGAVLDSSLGRWLDADAGPELAEVLSKHPRFKGEKLQFTVLDAGKPTPNGNELALAVEQRLTTHLLKRPGVMLAWRNRPTSCEIHHVALFSEPERQSRTILVDYRGSPAGDAARRRLAFSGAAQRCNPSVGSERLQQPCPPGTRRHADSPFP